MEGHWEKICEKQSHLPAFAYVASHCAPDHIVLPSFLSPRYLFRIVFSLASLSLQSLATTFHVQPKRYAYDEDKILIRNIIHTQITLSPYAHQQLPISASSSSLHEQFPIGFLSQSPYLNFPITLKAASHAFHNKLWKQVLQSSPTSLMVTPGHHPS